MYQFSWLPGTLVQPELLQELSLLYSEQYGVWGDGGIKPGKHVSLSPERLKDWLVEDSHVVWASLLGNIVGYAVAIRSRYKENESIAWVTQLVVHEDHRNRDIAKRLLFSIWQFTDHSAWGVLSANPYAIRALEKATRRRCVPGRIKIDVNSLLRLGRKQVQYVNAKSETVVTDTESRINTQFFLDHQDLPKMLESVRREGIQWALGPLEEGWEWFAFTFRDQPQLSLKAEELSEMLAASDQITHEAFSRMLLTDGTHRWAAFAEVEANFIVETFGLMKGAGVLDFGCGVGRHSIQLAKLGMVMSAVDYVPAFIQQAVALAEQAAVTAAITFTVGDCRTIDLRKKFDFAICVYDVVGTYIEPLDNRQILSNLREHLKPGGKVLISVMNFELTKQKATNWFTLRNDADALLALPASTIMEETGNIFDPKYYMIDTETNIVYRKEQFKRGDSIPEEMIVRDRRFSLEEIQELCQSLGFDVVWARRVRAGAWTEDLGSASPRAKEILLYCQLKGHIAQQSLF